MLIVVMQPLHHGLRVASRAFSHPRGTIAQGDLVKSEEALAAASVRGTQGLLAQLHRRLAPAFVVNVQHQSEPSL